MTATDTVLIHAVAEDGTTTEHRFDVLPLTNRNRKRLRAYVKATQGGLDTTEPLETIGAIVGALDHMMRSTGGGATLTSLWDDGLIDVQQILRLVRHIIRDA